MCRGISKRRLLTKEKRPLIEEAPPLLLHIIKYFYANTIDSYQSIVLLYLY